MWEFAQAALPWVAMGVAIAVLAAGFSGRKSSGDEAVKAARSSVQENAEGRKREQSSYMTEGMCLGMCLGAGLAAAGLFAMGTGVSIGMLLGMAVGINLKK